MLTADAFGVLPPIARLTREQALFYFLSGYTAKVAGTEIGVTEPQATFSACFGAPFLPQHRRPCTRSCSASGSTAMARRSGSSTPAGREARTARVSGCRSARRGRCCQRPSLGKLDNGAFRTDDVFGFHVPESVPGVDKRLLDPRSTWRDPEAYDAQAAKLAQMFADNFAKFGDAVAPEIAAARSAKPVGSRLPDGTKGGR